MSLYVIATPIGQPKDIGYRAKELLQGCKVIIGEEPKSLFRQLASFSIQNVQHKQIYFLNEHISLEDKRELLALCLKHEVAFIVDCGTPGFCDPGAELVRDCRKAGVIVHSVPGPSSLTAFLSICGRSLDEFVFLGFLPVKRAARTRALRLLREERRPIILMDTPYRLKSLLMQLEQELPKRKIVVGICLSTAQERLLSGSPAQVLVRLPVDKAEFIMLLEGN